MNWTMKIKREEYANRKILEIIDISRRHLRGTDEQEYLLRDLANIEAEAKDLFKVLNNPKEVYTEYEIEMRELERFKADIEKTVQSSDRRER